MWYYELKGKTYGPFKIQTLASLFHSGRLTRKTFVWRQDWSDWVSLEDTAIITLPVENKLEDVDTEEITKTTIPIQIEHSPENFYSPTHSGVCTEGLIKLFWWWFGTMLFFFPYLLLIYILGLSFPNYSLLYLTLPCSLPVVANQILQYFLIYKLWKVIQDGHARTSAEKAVGFLFIPYFNYYWFYQAFFGLSKGLNEYIERHFRPTQDYSIRKTKPGISLSYVLYYWCMIVGNTIVSIIMVIKGPSALFGSLIFEPFLTYAFLFLVFLIIWYIIQAFMFFDLFLSAKSILKAEDKQQA